MRTFKVITPTRVMEDVQADYFKLQDGHLIFRNYRAGPNSYPETVKMYAPGAWSTVEPYPEQRS